MIPAGKRKFPDGAAEPFGKNNKPRKQIAGRVDELYRQIGEFKAEKGRAEIIPNGCGRPTSRAAPWPAAP